jgi:hypothetical protein
MKCNYCDKKIRKDNPDKIFHISCLKKINQERYNERMNELIDLMKKGMERINTEKDLRI